MTRQHASKPKRRALAASFVATVSTVTACSPAPPSKSVNPPPPPATTGAPAVLAPEPTPSATVAVEPAPKEAALPALSASERLSRRDDGTCWGYSSGADRDVKRRQVECPPLREAPANWQVTTRANGTCWGHPKITCPKGTPGQRPPTCNPPHVKQVKCP